MKNDRLKEPKRIRKHKEAIVYSLLDMDGCVLIGGAHFLPTWDSTDHFNFACDCGAIAEIVEVKYRPDYPVEEDTLFFYLECPKCGRTGQRKTYLKYRERMAFCQRTFTNQNEELRYFNKNEPETKTPMIPNVLIIRRT
jgi:hypothetical protein